MKLTSKFTWRTEAPMPGALGGLQMTLQPTEVANAIASGTGPGAPDVNGTPTAGTIVGGMLVTPNSSGTYDLMSSPNLSSTSPILPFVVFEGDDDFSGAAAGVVIAVHGPGRLDTEQLDPAVSTGSYTPNVPLTASAANPGTWAVKVGADDKQIVGYVGPRGLLGTVLDVLAPQGVIGWVG
jgi:hypothetical protein